MTFRKNTSTKRRLNTIVIAMGLAIIFAGIVFQLQSISILGPESSFMYNNESWTLNGIIIVTLGIVLLLIGLVNLMRHYS
ncbi:MAG TPA: hypothetical protein VD815_03960 [Candidatus Saccharimonadales bacterium]|nr:hypothetical protein [Candidatus Saccharimonadales bacterium]